LGVWEGSYQNTVMKWMRWWDEQGQLLLTGIERAEEAERALYQEVRERLEAEIGRQQEAEARLQAEAAQRQAEEAQLNAIPQLQQMGMTPEQIAAVLSLPLERVLD